MKKFMKMAIAAVLIVFASSCTSIKQTAPVMAIGGNNITTNVAADIDYDGVTKVKGTATTTRVLWIFKNTANGNKQLKTNNRYRGLNSTEAAALYRAKTAADVDLILEPQFESQVKSYFFGIFKKTTVTMTGWGANIKGFKEGNSFNTTEGFNGYHIF